MKFKLKINYKEPTTYIDFLTLTMLVWYDIYTNRYTSKTYSKYYQYISNMFNGCPLCQYHKVDSSITAIKRCCNCILDSCYDNNSICQKYHKVDSSITAIKRCCNCILDSCYDNNSICQKWTDILHNYNYNRYAKEIYEICFKELKNQIRLVKKNTSINNPLNK